MQKLRVLGTNKTEVEFAADLFAKVLPGAKAGVAGDGESTGTGYFAALVDYQSEYAGNSLVVLVLDPALGGLENLTAGLEGGGWVVLNLPEVPYDMSGFTGFRLAFVDAGRIVARVVSSEFERGPAKVNRPDSKAFAALVSFAMLGAFARILGEPPLATIESILLSEEGADIVGGGRGGATEDALKIVQAGYDTVTIHGFVPRPMLYGKLS